MKNRKLFVLSIDIILFILVVSMLSFASQMPILFIFTLGLAIIVDQYIVSRREYLES